MKKILLIALAGILLLGCANRSEKPYVAVSNRWTNGDFFVPLSYITQDNATHVVITIPKYEAGVAVNYYSAVK